MKNLSLRDIYTQFKQVGQFFYAHDRMIYFIMFVSALCGAVLGLNLALTKPTDESYRAQKLSEAQSSRFDTQTIDKIKSLNSRQQTTTDEAPSGIRNNPFGE